jgi:aquaporin Z
MFNLKVFLAELIGTFALVFVSVAAGVVSGAGAGQVGIALASGFALTMVVFVFGGISGAHVNPAVTFAMALNGTVKWLEAVFYWIAQFVGAIAAAFLLNFFVTTLGGTIDAGASIGALTSPSNTTDPTKLFMMGMAFEAILTFFLVSVYFTVMSGKAGNSGHFALGATIVFASLAGGLFTGASLNPARTLGTAIFATSAVLGLASPFLYVVYFVGPLLGATLAVLAYNYFSGIMDDDIDDELVEVVEVEEEEEVVVEVPVARAPKVRKAASK